MGGIENHFPVQNAGFCIYNLKLFPGVISRDLRKRAVLRPRHQFPLVTPEFLLFLFYETTTGEEGTVGKGTEPLDFRSQIAYAQL